MSQKKIKCIRCNGKGNVRKYIIYGCPQFLIEIWDVITSTTLYFPLYLLASFIIGGIFGFFYFILLKNALTFNIFGISFYLLGGMSMCFILFILFFEYKTIFRNRIIIFIILVLLIYFGYQNMKLSRYLFNKKGFFNILLNLIYAFIQGGSTGFTFSYLILRKSMLEENNGRTQCPLCEGNKYISEKYFNEIQRCAKCKINCGYENPIGISLFQKRFFCKECHGLGYNKIKKD